MPMDGILSMRMERNPVGTWGGNMKIAVVISLLLSIFAGCGEIEWFPEGTSFSNISTPTFGNNTSIRTSVTDSSGTLTASNLAVSEVFRDELFVTVSMNVDVTNSGSEATPATISIAGTDSTGAELAANVLDSPGIAAGERNILTGTLPVDRATFPRIVRWRINTVERL